MIAINAIYVHKTKSNLSGLLALDKPTFIDITPNKPKKDKVVFIITRFIFYMLNTCDIFLK